jgi:ribosomal-protein-alanine N-acetyltransferase
MYELDTARLHLRPLEPGDLDDYYRRIFADPEVMRGLPSGKPVPRESFDGRIRQVMLGPWEEHGFGPWIVVHRADGRVIGHCGLRHWDELSGVEVFYALARSYWGAGLATEGARASLRFGFEHLGLERIVAAAKADNLASRRVLEKIGMTFERTDQVLGIEGARYAITRAEFADDGSPYRLIARAGPRFSSKVPFPA